MTKIALAVIAGAPLGVLLEHVVTRVQRRRQLEPRLHVAGRKLEAADVDAIARRAVRVVPEQRAS